MAITYTKQVENCDECPSSKFWTDYENETEVYACKEIGGRSVDDHLTSIHPECPFLAGKGDS